MKRLGTVSAEIGATPSACPNEQPEMQAQPGHFVAGPAGNQAAWHLQLLEDFQDFLGCTVEENNEIHGLARFPWETHRPWQNDLLWSLRLDPALRIRLANSDSARRLPSPEFPVLPQYLLNDLEKARHFPAQAAHCWRCLKESSPDNPLRQDLIETKLGAVAHLLANRPLTWELQLHFGYAMRQEAERLHLTGNHWNYGQAWRISAAFRSFCESYPQLGLCLARQISCEALTEPRANHLVENILGCGLSLLLRWSGLPDHPGMAKLLAKIPCDQVDQETCDALRESTKNRETILHLLNLPGSIPPRLLTVCQPSAPRVSFPLLRQMQAELNPCTSPSAGEPLIIQDGPDCLWRYWQMIACLLQKQPTEYQTAINQRLQRATSRRTLQRILRSLEESENRTPFGPPPKPGNRWIHPVQSVRELQDAANTFRNCLRTCLWPTAQNVRQGTSYFYRVRVGNATSLLQITRLPAGDWSLREHLGVGNRPAPKSCQVKVANWARRHGLFDLVG